MPRFLRDLLARLGRYLSARYGLLFEPGEVGAFRVSVSSFYDGAGAARDAYSSATADAAGDVHRVVEVFAGNINRGRKVIPAK